MEKVAFVLDGGAAKGAYQANALCRLTKEGINPHMLFGVSSGAINTFGYSAIGPARLYQFWEKLTDIKDVFSVSYLNILFGTGLYKTDPLINKVKKEIALSLSLKRDIMFPYVDAFSGEIIYSKFVAGVKPQNVLEELKRAIAIPAVIEAEENGRYVDAGAKVLCPLKQAIESGADTIYIILTKKLDELPKFSGEGLFFNKRLLKIATYAYRFNDLLMFEIFRRDIKDCLEKNLDSNFKIKKKRFINLYLVEPDEDTGNSLDFSKTPQRLRAPIKITKLSN